MRALLAGTIRIASHAGLVQPVLAQLIEHYAGEVALRGHRRIDRCRLDSGHASFLPALLRR
jgi:hypothetical protein